MRARELARFARGQHLPPHRRIKKRAPKSSNVLLIAATNRAADLDPALLRPGRFDRQVEIPLPNLLERTAILEAHSRDKHVGHDVDFDAVARSTPGFSGADLANLVNEAAIVAVRDDRNTILAADFSEARDRILLGRREATNALMPGEKRVITTEVRESDTRGEKPRILVAGYNLE